MKKVLLAAICSFIAISSFAQSTVDDEISIMQTIYGMNKKQLIGDHLKLSQAEALVFWPIYEEYETARKELGKQRADVILDYAGNYTGMSNEKATELVNAAISNQSAFLKLQQKTFKKVSKALTPARAAQFYQAEMYLENVIRMALSEEIPLLGEFDNLMTN